MRKVSRNALLALLTALFAAGLAACGGGGSSTTAVPQTEASTPSPATKSPRRQGASDASTPQGSTGSSAGAKAGAAKPFVKPHADNSIPTFGSEAAPSQRSQAEAALRAYLTARAKGEWARACAGLAAALRKQVQAFAGGAKGKGCAPIYKALSSSSPASTRANPLSGPLLSLRAEGQSGFALFYGPEKQKYVMPMASEGGAWKVTQLAPIAYPLGSQTATSP
jgi:hypothetical protein